jgi:L-threonylcarbamoyladenylate synthase
MMLRHYAPRTPLECVEIVNEERVQALCQAGHRIGWVTFSEAPSLEHDSLVARRLPADVPGYSAQLYAVLHELDALGLDRIVVTLPPNTVDWLAVRDRLKRAASRPKS